MVVIVNNGKLAKKPQATSAMMKRPIGQRTADRELTPWRKYALEANDVRNAKRMMHVVARCCRRVVVLPPKFPFAGVAFRRPPSQVGQCKCGFAVSAVSGAKQRKQGGVLRDGQDLPVAKRPVPGGEIACKGDYRSDKYFHDKIY